MKKLSPISYFPCNGAASIKYFYAHYAHGNRADIEYSDENRKQQWFFGMRIHYPTNSLTLIDRQNSFSSFVYVFPYFLGR